MYAFYSLHASYNDETKCDDLEKPWNHVCWEIPDN